MPKILPKKSTQPGKSPTASDLAIGEIAMNLADRRIFSKNAAGDVIEMGGSSITASATPPASPSTGQLWLNTDTLRVFAYYDNAWVELVNPGSTAFPYTVRSAVSGSTLYLGRATTGTAETDPGWSITRIITAADGTVTSTATASGAWSDRASLNYV